MPKADKPVYNIADPELADIINDYLDAKRKKDEATKTMDECLSKIEEYTDIDKESPYEGTVIVRSGNVNVELEYKLTYKVDKETAFRGCNELGVDPLILFNADLKYSRPKFSKLTDAEKEVVMAATTTSRAKTSIKFN